MQKGFESGRSMVEMLGVLAVIGVLSIGGIAAYVLAMSKSKANDISQAVRIDITQMQISEDQSALTDPEVTEAGGATIEYFDLGTKENAGIQVDFGSDNEKACRQFYDMYKDNADYTVKVMCDGTVMGE